MANCFDNVPFEAIDTCPNDEISGGAASRGFYAPVAFVDKCVLPANTGALGVALTITEGNLTLKSEKTWKGIDFQKDETELKNILVGNVGNKKGKTELEFKVAGFRAEVIDFVNRYKNVPMVFVIPDAAGQLWVVGTKLNGAFIETADSTTGKKAEDDSGTMVKITCNSKVYKYAGTIAEG
ncbi:hypothetical protein [Capnocytophaga canimorsus]|uniref:hypothetical protein n=1 Tax=Capnocytophaga canimorsus TaxID=28188 RepID=UPI0028EAEC34|nr:hypothetical protein [Capnocytophaga canimorsus]MDT9499146.1 hypothetical protein [Capnocytophaga canimorsus]